MCCALAHRLGPVEAFIDENCVRLQEEALFKFAALVWAEKVKAPAEAEGAVVPAISWQELRNHFCLHAANARVQRAAAIKQLVAMRAKVSERLVRYDDSDPTGRGEIDKASADLLLKLMDKESKERSLLFPEKAGAQGRRPAGAPASDD